MFKKYFIIDFILVKAMMYGFGDDENPYQESVELLEDMVLHFIQNMVRTFYLNVLQ